ncbi:ABC transporter permease [Variovorax paradoxus]|uniref:ABC transporter permease n=1 Tax=Variovorax paradoxus TaxID=34073 RepID=UPI001ABC338A
MTASHISSSLRALPRLARAASGIALVIALLALWEASARLGWVDSLNWPPFTAVLAALRDGLWSGELPALLGNTLGYMLVGYAAGSAAGIALGLLLGLSPLLMRIVSPLVEALRPIPISAIVPPLILFLGVGDALKIFIVAFSSFFPVLINTVAGVRDGSPVLRQTARTLRLSRAATLRKLVLPGALPAIFAGLRTSLGIALVVAIIAEMVAGASGIGYFIVQAQYAMQPAPMYAAVLCLSLAGYALNRAILRFEKTAQPWHGRA